MRVSLLSGATLYPLAGQEGVPERLHSTVADFRHTPAINAQESSKVRASYAGDYDRGNLKHSLSFSTTRMFATVAAAMLFDLDYDGTVARTGTLILETVRPDGAIFRRHMANALVYPPARRVVGCTVFLDYQVTGGAITAAEGTPAPDPEAPTLELLLDVDGNPVLAFSLSYIFTTTP